MILFFCYQLGIRKHTQKVLLLLNLMSTKLKSNPTTSKISLLLHKSKVDPRMSVNNKDILRVWWDLTDFYPIALINHVFYQNNVLECM